MDTKTVELTREEANLLIQAVMNAPIQVTVMKVPAVMQKIQELVDKLAFPPVENKPKTQ